MGLKITQTAHYVPPKVVTNDDLTTMMDTSDEWISSRTGIKQRHLAQGEQTSDLAVKVANQLLEQANCPAEQIDFIIVATMSPDYLTPATAAIVQGKIGAKNALAFDINAACSGFIYALALADKLLTTYQRGIVIGAEVLSKLVDWQERSTAVLFGDGAGGVLVEQSPQQSLIAEDLTAYGQDGQTLTAGYQPLDSAFNQDPVALHKHYFEMDGRAVYRFATHEVPASIDRTLAKAEWQLNDVDWFILHQANGRILTSIAHHLGVPEEKFLCNVAKYGNTSAASVPLLLDEAVTVGKIKPQQRLILSGFGGGLTAATVAIIF
ncbi:beta-ketoacyl-ACP synthase III [Lactobacillus sp. ESL0677]|uniref:beta-ketoacyl-ACP synthase III n=1 Tax=Lactobacillus sp. ESL0677 TaxID=2983208 RepID=UPI0023F6D5E6|nr:beta-ketoacyl-ACP synthase III [Lactobacillus sp. ESL0677]WEV37145.1 ketoacyl-ACP synthase III [Lactobacillus sp. ESL0677]